VAVALSGLGVATVVLGLLLGLQGYNDMMKSHNPQTYARWQRALSVCGAGRG
jgi:hypothetical protein